MIAVRHRSASGANNDGWELEPREGRVTAHVKQGSHVLALTFTVASLGRPRMGARQLVRVDEESWRVLPVCFVCTWATGKQTFDTYDSPLGDLAPGDNLLLTNANTLATAILEAL